VAGQAQAIGIDVGGTKTAALRVNLEGEILAREVLETPADDMDATLATMVEAAKAVLSPEVRAVGIGAAGLVEAGTGRLIFAPNLAWRNVLLADHIWDSVGLPAFADNDNNVAAWGEYRHGAGRGYRHMLFVGVGTGIGGGIIADGKLLRGAHGFAAEIGHFQIDPAGPMCACGERGHWEAMASGNALGRMAREAAVAGDAPSLVAAAGGDIDAIDGHHVSAAAHAGAPDALALVDQYSFNVAIGLVGLANIFDPSLIAISGGLVNDGDIFLDPMRRHFLGHIEGAEYRPTPEIVPAEAGERAGVIGAGLLALDRYPNAGPSA